MSNITVSNALLRRDCLYSDSLDRNVLNTSNFNDVHLSKFEQVVSRENK